jgi:hypothetical protein
MKDVRVRHGCWSQLAHGDARTGYPPRVASVTQFAYEGSTLRFGDVLDAMTTLAYHGASPPNACVWCRNSAPPHDYNAQCDVEWTAVPGTSWWRWDGFWMFPRVELLEGGGNGSVLVIGFEIGSLRDAVLDGAPLDTVPLTDAKFDSHKATHVVPILPSGFLGQDADADADAYTDAEIDVDLDADLLFDTVGWCTDTQPSACLKLNNYARLYITPALGDAVMCGILGNYDSAERMAYVWLGQINVKALPSVTWSKKMA